MEIRILKLVFIVITFFAVCACTGSSSDPVAVAEKFAKAYFETDFDKCNKLMLEDERNRFVPSSEMSDAEKQLFKMMQQDVKKMKYKLKLNNEEIKIDGDYAKIKFNVTSASESSFNEEFTVTLAKAKKTSKWFVEKHKTF